ncbi:prolactin-2C5-like [Onychomys torridus]|uniref:prolactin-2C5-like n=1 Tax=Onychomys torridus TaxID=38674 RepID=UPI00167FDC79|nr:prolactin-2C5-like [Onychomys torridus]
MQLSLTQPRSWTLLLLLVSNLLLWENVVSVPMCAMRNGRCFVSLKDMFDLAGSLSHEISQEVSGMLTEFKKHYAEVHGLNDIALTSCHTSSLSIPENKEQAMNTHYEVLLKSADILLGAWKNPLQHLENEIATLKGVPAGVVSKAKRIKEKDSGLLEGTKSLINMIHIGETENYPTWSGLASLQSDNEDARILAFYNLISCLDHDSKKVDTCLNIVKCKVSQPDNC